ncbi:MAG: DUF4832 domain-containing protein [Bacteroidales bacterium]|nr:DUF4832 domain-containing protein [Bacteroidales bacterium]
MNSSVPSRYYSGLLNLSVIILILIISADCSQKENTGKGILEEDKGFLQIPGVGWQTFFRTAQDDPSIAGLPFKSGCAYMRWTWGDLEPAEGQYAFDMIDEWLERCRQANQALAFRVMLSWPGHEGTIPQWLIDKGIKYTFSECPEEGAHYEVDLEEAVVWDLHEKLIRALGMRYDGHPDLALVDIGSVGLWGEWHNYCDPKLMPGDATRKKIIDLYYEVFPNTPLTALVDDKDNVLYANSKGRSAWRGDCWGDGEGPGVGWNHHSDSYWPMVEMMPDGWKTGTVALEPCGTFGGYPTPPKSVVDDAIAWHASLIQNKSHYIPANWLPEIERLVMKLGFRLVLRDIDYPENAGPGSEIPVSMNWENLGIAPPYRDHRIAFRMKGSDGNNYGVIITDATIRGWLPGDKSISISYRIPDEIKSGTYSFEMGVVFHNSLDHVIPIANKGKTTDGWYTIGSLRVN